jgi:hypothetical protein
LLFTAPLRLCATAPQGPDIVPAGILMQRGKGNLSTMYRYPAHRVVPDFVKIFTSGIVCCQFNRKPPDEASL